MKSKLMREVGLFIIIFLIVTGCGNKESKIKEASLGKLSFSFPGVFKLVNEDIEEGLLASVEYRFVSDNRKDGCYLKVKRQENEETNLKEVVKDKLIYNGEENISYATKDINGNLWTTGSVSFTKKRDEYSYVINHEGNLYKVHYLDMGSGNLCAEYFNTIEKSLNFN